MDLSYHMIAVLIDTLYFIAPIPIVIPLDGPFPYLC